MLSLKTIKRKCFEEVKICRGERFLLRLLFKISLLESFFNIILFYLK